MIVLGGHSSQKCQDNQVKNRVHSQPVRLLEAARKNLEIHLAFKRISGLQTSYSVWMKALVKTSKCATFNSQRPKTAAKTASSWWAIKVAVWTQWWWQPSPAWSHRPVSQWTSNQSKSIPVHSNPQVNQTKEPKIESKLELSNQDQQ